MKLHTARYSNKNIPASGLVPVRITLGHPRFRLAYADQLQVMVWLAPNRSYFHLPEPEFAAQYRAHLDKLGVQMIRENFEELSARCGGRDLVLLCFENLVTPKPGDFCHRTIFATWWTERTGETVEELSEAPQPALL